MEGEFIIIALISTIGGLAGLMMINHNWFKRMDVKYKYRLRTAKLNKRYKTNAPSKEENNIVTSLIKKYGPQLLEEYMGEGGEEEEESDLTTTLIKKFGPALVDKYLSGGKEKPNKEEEPYIG